jgi:hypothetical protein
MSARFAVRCIVRTPHLRACQTGLQRHTVILVFSATIFKPGAGPNGVRPGPAAATFLIAPPRFAPPGFRL